MIFLYFLHKFHLMAKIYMPICPHCQKKKLINYQIPTPPTPPPPKRNPAQICTCTCISCIYKCTCKCIYITVYKLIWCTIGPKSFLFGTAQFSLWASSTVNYDYIASNSINFLLIGSRCIPNGWPTNHY